MVHDLVVCGGGAVGLAIAWEAASRGLTVVLLEKRHLGSGASWAGAGILPPGATKQVFDPIEVLRGESHQMFPQWCQRLQAETEIDVGFRKSGGIYLARSVGEKATLAANEAWWSEHGIEFERLDRSELTRCMPALNPSRETSLFEGWSLPQECQVRNPRYLRALAVACRKRGVTILENEGFEALEELPRSSLAIVSRNGRYSTKRVCFTAGAWSPLLLETVRISTEVFPIRGQMVLFKLDVRPFEFIVNEGHRYLVPRDDGYVLAGSCEEEVGYDERTTPEMIDDLTQWALELAPILATGKVEKTWAGLRPASLDGLPYLGKLPQLDNCYLAAGHFRHGLHLSPITADCMVDLMTDIPPRLDLSAFRVLRGKSSR